MFVGASNLQITGSTLSVAGGDVVHNNSIHYHYGRPRESSIWEVFESIPNFRRIYLDMLSKATLGTGVWLVKSDKFRVWLEPNGDLKIFWGSGIRQCSLHALWYPHPDVPIKPALARRF